MSHPTIINLPQPSSNPDTPSEMPGTPTSTTTSLSALSTIAIKDGHRGTHGAPLLGQRTGHQHHSSINSLEAERADRISRLPGLSSVAALRGQPGGANQAQQLAGQQTTPTSSNFHSGAASGLVAPQVLGVPAYFDSNGQPVAVTKMSTVGSASATESVGGRTATDLSGGGINDDGDQDMKDDEDLLSMDTNYREVDSGSGYMGAGVDPMDEELANRSVGGYEDRMSDDGSASLVGFGEGANSTISGPIYVRRPLPGGLGLERSSSGLSEGAFARRGDREKVSSDNREEAETLVSAQAAAERRAARMLDGIAADGVPHRAGTADEEEFVDTTTRSPVPIGSIQPGHPSAIRETQQPHSYQQGRELAERVIRDRFDGTPALGSPGRSGERLGQFNFEDRQDRK